MKLYNDIINEINLKGLDGNVIVGIQNLITSGKFDEIERFIEKLSRFSASNHMIGYMVFISMSLARLRKHIGPLNNLSIAYPDSLEVLIAIAEYQLSNDNTKSALETLENLMSKSEESDIISFLEKSIRIKSYNLATERLIKLALQKYPKKADIINISAFFLKKNARYEEAVHMFYKSIALDDTNPIVWQAISECLSSQNLNAEALDAAKQMHALDSNSLSKTRAYYGALIKAAEESRATEGEVFNNALKTIGIINEVTELITSNLILDDIGIVLKYALEYEMYKLYKIDKREEYLINRNTLISLMYYMDDVRTKEDKIYLLESHKKWAKNITSKSNTQLINQKIHCKNSNDKINLGIVSYGVRDCIIGKFLKPVIDKLDTSIFNLHIYALGLSKEDEFSNFCLSKSYKFKRYVGQLAQGHIIAESIRNDRIDATLDVGVGLRHSIYKPSTVSIAWLDYPHSSGLPVDHMIVDPYVNPTPDLILEKPLMLPESWLCIDKDMFGNWKIEDTLPSDRKGYITFGTMNASFKITEEVLRSWARIMHLLPNSRFLYSRPTAASKVLRDNFCRKMLEYGIESDRIMFVASRHKSYMDFYNHIDVALDSFPRTGGTTTCETLWMGVPVVTLVGDAMFERLSYSNLMNIGAGDLCAFNIEDYERIAVELSYDRERRLAFRNNIRERILQSPLGDANRFAHELSKAITNSLNTK